MVIKFFLVWYDHLATILSVTAIVTTIILTAFHKSQKEDKDKKTSSEKEEAGRENRDEKTISFARVLAAIIILLLVIGLSATSWHVYKNWTIIPNLSGRTYDDAMSVLYDSRLNGQLVLAETNSNLASSDSRIVWQNYAGNAILGVGTTVSFLIDDCFSLNSTPLTQYEYKDLVIDQTQKLDYKCDYKDAIQQAAEQERYAIENGVPVEYSIADPHWMIEIDAAELKYEAHVSTWHGILFTKADSSYSYRVYGGAMSATLEELVTSSAALLSGVALLPDLDECTIVGKLIPTSGQDNTVLCELPFPNYTDNNSKIFLPQTLLCGDYTFAFSIIDEDDQLYEWYHYITIVDKE